MAYSIKERHRAPAILAPVAEDPHLPRVCIIGAGSSGLAAAKTLYEKRIPFDCFEMGSEIGGNWLLGNPNGVSACYETLQINTSCPRMAFSDFPMPEDYPPYAMHDQVHEYFEDYTAHFGFRHKITFNTEVTDVRRAGKGWDVTIVGPDGQETRHYAAVLVANGHHWDPRWPEPAYPGEFDGEQIHAHSYTSGDQLEGRDVVVVGAGNSAMDISVEGSYRANSVNISIRRGQWILRKMLGPIAADTIALPGWLPWWATAARLRTAAILSGSLKKYGLPTPPHAPGQSHPVQSDTFKNRIGTGAITVRPAISRLAGDRVEFIDGSHAKADLIVWATGYNVSFPFLDFLDVVDNDLPLWKRTIHPEHPGLFFLGLLQPVGAVMPLAEAQAKWIAEILRREYVFPPLATIEREMSADDARNKRQFYSSPRHTMEVDFDNYLWDLGRERARGRARARKVER